MDIQKAREEFEKLYKSKINTYAKFDKSEYTGEYTDYQEQVCFEIYQEQQNKIDSIKAMAENWINQEYTYNSDSTDIKIQQMKDCGRDIIRKINGLSANEYREAFARQQAEHQANLYMSIMKKGEDK